MPLQHGLSYTAYVFSHTEQLHTVVTELQHECLSGMVHNVSLTQPCICSRCNLTTDAALQGSSGSFRDDERQGMQRSLSRHLERLRRAEQVLSAVMPRCCSCIMPMLHGLNADQLASSEYI